VEIAADDLDFVQQELSRAKGQWPEIAEGAKLHYTTVVRIGNKRAKNPGSNTIRKLVAYFKART
jgi:hypothetical protein